MADETQEYNSQFVQDTTAQATQAANAAYQQGMLENARQDLAFKKAQQAWKETMEKAGLTGTYEGMPTQQALQFAAEQFGTWGAPQQGAETLASRQQTFQQGQDVAGLYGANYGPGGPGSGQQTLAGSEQAYTQALRAQQEQRAAQAQQQSQAQQYLQLLSQLRGPADWVKYQQVLGSTPGGMRDLVGAAMGQYTPGGGATTGYQPQAVSLQSLQGDVTGQAYYGQGGGQLGTPDIYQYNPAVYGQQQQPSGAQQTYAQLQGQVQPQQYAQQATQPQPANNQAVNAMGNGTNTMGATAQNQYQQAMQTNLPAPNQIAPQSWNNLAPSQKEMLLGQYEAQGWHKPDVEALRNQALPKYAANAPTAGTFRLR